MKKYGYNRVKLSQNYSIKQLEELKSLVIEEHKHEPKSGVGIYSKKCMKKLDQIDWAIYYHQRANNPQKNNGAMCITHVNTGKFW